MAQPVESTCNTGDIGDVSLISGLGRCSRGRRMATHSSILAGESHGQKSLEGYIHVVTKSWT